MTDNKEEKTLEQLEEENKVLRRMLAEKENAEIRKALQECADDSSDEDDESELMQYIRYDEERRSKSRTKTVLIVILVLFGLWLLGQYTLSHLNYTITFG